MEYFFLILLGFIIGIFIHYKWYDRVDDAIEFLKNKFRKK